MANKAYSCRDCDGNMWTDSASGRDHKHLDPVERRYTLKLKLRTRFTGKRIAAKPRTNAAKNTPKTIKPRRRAYGPF